MASSFLSLLSTSTPALVMAFGYFSGIGLDRVSLRFVEYGIIVECVLFLMNPGSEAGMTKARKPG